jgi:hypothetical protein
MPQTCLVETIKDLVDNTRHNPWLSSRMPLALLSPEVITCLEGYVKSTDGDKRSGEFVYASNGEGIHYRFTLDAQELFIVGIVPNRQTFKY